MSKLTDGHLTLFPNLKESFSKKVNSLYALQST
jgi:hypothetical protein